MKMKTQTIPAIAALLLICALPAASAQYEGCIITSDPVPAGEVVAGESAQSVLHMSGGCPAIVSRIATGWYVVDIHTRQCFTTETLKPYGTPSTPVPVFLTDNGYWRAGGFLRHFGDACTIQVFPMPKDRPPVPAPSIQPAPEPEPEPEWTANGIRDGTETDTDCGGDLAPACASGQKCLSDPDCANTCNHYKTPNWYCDHWHGHHCMDWDAYWTWEHSWHFGSTYQPTGRCSGETE